MCASALAFVCVPLSQYWLLKAERELFGSLGGPWDQLPPALYDSHTTTTTTTTTTTHTDTHAATAAHTDARITTAGHGAGSTGQPPLPLLEGSEQQQSELREAGAVLPEPHLGALSWRQEWLALVRSCTTVCVCV